MGMKALREWKIKWYNVGNNIFIYKILNYKLFLLILPEHSWEELLEYFYGAPFILKIILSMKTILSLLVMDTQVYLRNYFGVFSEYN